VKKLLELLALAPSPYAAEVNVKLLDLLYSNFLRSSLVMVGVASLLAYALWSSVDQTLLLVWYGVIVLITIVRLTNAFDFIKHRDEHIYAYWYSHFTIGILSTALVWSIVPLLFFSAANVALNFFIAFVLLGMIAGASATLASDLRLTHIYLYLLFFPLLYSFMQSSGVIYTAATFMTIMFIPIVSISARRFHSTLVETYHTAGLYKDTKEALQNNERRLSLMFQQAPIGIFFYDNKLTILDCNTKLEEIMHASREQLVGLNLNMIPDSRPLDVMRGSLTKKTPTTYEGPYKSKVADLDLIVKIQMTPLIEADGSVHGGLCMFEDKTKEHMALQEAEFLSLHDHLTGLPNRKLLKERMKQTLAEQERHLTYSALLFLDLDHFKQINDSLGHGVGDDILIETAHRLTKTLRKSDTLSRLGGDEFVILIPQLSVEEDEAVRHAYEVAQKIHDVMSEAFSVDKQLLFSSASIGISLFNAQLDESDEILRRADMAMYQSKAQGRKRTSFYDEAMDREMQHYIEMKKNLLYAIEGHELSLYFQPILTIDSKKIVAAEALLRWKHKGEFVSTVDLIKVAEESSLINEIGRWVIEQTCLQIKDWREAEQFTLDYVTINISARQLLEEGFSDFLLTTIAQYCLDHKVLKLEITETALITNFDKAKQVIDKLNTMGIDFIIDDFGTGYSSLSYLKQLPFSALKIDKSFVKDILTDPEDEKLIRAIINTAEQFNYAIIAEGIEEEAQRAILQEIHPALYYQGYLASKPLPADEFLAYLNE